MPSPDLESNLGFLREIGAGGTPIDDYREKLRLLWRLSDGDSIELEERSPIRDQLLPPRLGCCVSAAFLSAIEHLDPARRVFSTLAAYNFACELGGHPRSDKGVTFSTMVRSLQTLGAPLEKDWPYRPEEFERGVPLLVRQRAFEMRGLQSYRIVDHGIALLDVLEDTLAADRKVVFGLVVGRAFVDYRSGVLPPPVRTLGDHTVLLAGVRHRGQGMGREWKIQNSFGREWGHHGYAWISSEYVLDVGNEFMVIL